MSTKTQAERIAALETQVALMLHQQEAMAGDIKELLALRYKGAGAFWLATSLFGISLAGLVTMVLQWWRS